MSKTNKTAPKTINCERYKKHLGAFNSFDKNLLSSMKKVVVSNKLCCTRDDKSFSTGVIISCKGDQVNTTKKTAKSDVLFDHNQTTANTMIDYCKNCGDVSSSIGINLKSGSSKSQNLPCHMRKCTNKISIKPTTASNEHKITVKCSKNKPIQQYYKNEKFHHSTGSLYAADNIKKASKASLNTIKEHSEKISPTESTIVEIHPENSEEELGFMDPNDEDNIKNIKMFRKQNYFECHSVKSRINSKGSVTSLNNHKCVYRFYLNHRLFPVPVNTDYQESVRCIECQLPRENNVEDSHINGTVQAKVKLNGEIQDMLLLLPVQNSLIIKERRKVLPVKEDYDSLYFGIIKLDSNGDSKFNRSLPSDSLALKYQKGYKELIVHKKYEYDCVQKDDIIIV